MALREEQHVWTIDVAQFLISFVSSVVHLENVIDMHNQTLHCFVICLTTLSFCFLCAHSIAMYIFFLSTNKYLFNIYHIVISVLGTVKWMKLLGTNSYWAWTNRILVIFKVNYTLLCFSSAYWNPPPPFNSFPSPNYRRISLKSLIIFLNLFLHSLCWVYPSQSFCLEIFKWEIVLVLNL